MYEPLFLHENDLIFREIFWDFCVKTLFPSADWINLSLDDKTANKMLWISDHGSRVCRRTEEVCPVLDRPERYEYSPQVGETSIQIQAI